MTITRRKAGTLLILLFGAVSVIGFIYSGPVPQDLSYHGFSDNATYWRVPNTLNVLSNVPFLVVGLMGVLVLLHKPKSLTIVEPNRLAYLGFFLGTAFVGLGSGYYHVSPDNSSLVWDRLPMTLSFMSFCSIVIGEFVSESAGRRLLFPFIFTGIGSVVYWWTTEVAGAGDLRFYAVVQFFPMLSIPVILLFFRPGFSATHGYWVLMASYFAAKLLEYYDLQIHHLLTYVSGHSLKHVAPALGIFYLLRTFQHRSRI